MRREYDRAGRKEHASSSGVNHGVCVAWYGRCDEGVWGMKPSDYFVILLYGTALFLTLKVLSIWWKGGLNSSGIMEWFYRGFFFTCGALTATLVLFLLIRMILGFSK